MCPGTGSPGCSWASRGPCFTWGPFAGRCSAAPGDTRVAWPVENSTRRPRRRPAAQDTGATSRPGQSREEHAVPGGVRPSGGLPACVWNDDVSPSWRPRETGQAELSARASPHRTACWTPHKCVRRPGGATPLPRRSRPSESPQRGLHKQGRPSERNGPLSPALVSGSHAHAYPGGRDRPQGPSSAGLPQGSGAHGRSIEGRGHQPWRFLGQEIRRKLGAL